MPRSTAPSARSRSASGTASASAGARASAATRPGGGTTVAPPPTATGVPSSLATLSASALSGRTWALSSACGSLDPDDLFVTGAAQNLAKVVCLHCPVRTECLADALDNRVEFGVWGGMTERERRALLRRRPEVESWSDLLQTARAEHDRAERQAG